MSKALKTVEIFNMIGLVDSLLSKIKYLSCNSLTQSMVKPGLRAINTQISTNLTGCLSGIGTLHSENKYSGGSLDDGRLVLGTSNDGDLNTGHLPGVRMPHLENKHLNAGMNFGCPSDVRMHPKNKTKSKLFVQAYICHPCDNAYMLWTNYKEQ